ncbi:MAG TPA: MCE family protein [Gammaproteobacteria bacterium]|nr:MCE family protein [Gammaproteobacteria bacterium]
MKKDNINYFMVGVFVITGLLVLFFMLFKLTGNQSDVDEYFVVFDNVSGMKNGVVVTYNGYAIGAVQGIEPVFIGNRARYKLILHVKSSWPIPVDSQAKIVMPAIISDKEIDIRQGVSAQVLQPGDTVQSVETVDIMMLVDSMAQELKQFVPESTENIRQLMAQLNYSVDQVAAILNESNVQHVNNFLKNADASGEKLLALTNSFQRLMHQLDNLIEKSELLVDDNSEDIRYTVQEMKKTMDEVAGKINSVMYNFDATSQNMNEFSRTLRNNPGALLGSQPPSDPHTGGE